MSCDAVCLFFQKVVVMYLTENKNSLLHFRVKAFSQHFLKQLTFISIQFIILLSTWLFTFLHYFLKVLSTLTMLGKEKNHVN